MTFSPLLPFRRALGRLKRATWDATGTLRRFMRYAWVQHRHAAVRERGPANRLSHINFKNAHYLEKAMLCGYPRTAELDACHAALSRYLNSPEGMADDCYFYLRKLELEYERYPDGFVCFMHKAPPKPWPNSYATTLRKIVVQRRSTRRFAPEPLDDAALEPVLEAGAYAPTSCNAQPLAFLTIRRRETLDLVFGAAAGAAQWADAVPTGIVIATDRRHYKPFDQHIVMFQDIAAAAQNCLLAAEANNLAACWVSLLSDTHIRDQDAIYRALGLPGYMAIGAAIAIGRKTNAVCMVPRRPMDRLVHRERFDGGGR